GRGVAVGLPLRLRARPAADGCHLELLEQDSVLVRGRVAAASDDDHAVAPVAPTGEAMDLPISRTCFACGVDNALGLGLRLRADADTVWGTWTPRSGFATTAGALASLALTTLLDETAFWLGALASGEAGMTTELRVTLHAEAAADTPIIVVGRRAAVCPRPG